MALGVPVMTSNTCSALELVENRHGGVVVENSDEGIKQGIRKILDDPKSLKEIKVLREDINKNACEQVNALVLRVRESLTQKG